MIQYIYADDLHHQPELQTSMYQDRRRQFKERQGWDVQVNAKGEELDEYDALNPLYIIAQTADGTHAGSLRLLPTLGPTMVNDYFQHLSGMTIRSPAFWESTRFCLAPNVQGPQNTAALLMLAACEVGLRFGINHYVGVFDSPMARVYRKIGWRPEIIGTDSGVSVGLWAVSGVLKHSLCTRHDILPRSIENGFEAAFPVSLAA